MPNERPLFGFSSSLKYHNVQGNEPWNFDMVLYFGCCSQWSLPSGNVNWDLGPQSDPCRSPNLALFGHEMVDLGLFLGIVAMSWIIGDITHVYHSVLDHPSSQSILHRWYYRNCANSFRIVVLSCSLWNIPPFVTGPGCFRTDLHTDGPSVSLVSLLVSWKSDPSKSKLFQPRIGQNLMIRPWLFTSGRWGTQPSQCTPE